VSIREVSPFAGTVGHFGSLLQRATIGFVTAPPHGQGTISISRRTLVQDAARRHIVLIDEQVKGSLWAFQTKQYPVSPGHHTVRLAPKEAIDWEPGKASSNAIPVDVRENETRHLRTTGRGWSGWTIKGMYRRPWIVLRLDDI
jgi:hypothetical protein